MTLEARILTLFQNRRTPTFIIRRMNEAHFRNVCSQSIFRSAEARLARIAKPIIDQALWHLVEKLANTWYNKLLVLCPPFLPPFPAPTCTPLLQVSFTRRMPQASFT